MPEDVIGSPFESSKNFNDAHFQAGAIMITSGEANSPFDDLLRIDRNRPIASGSANSISKANDIIRYISVPGRYR